MKRYGTQIAQTQRQGLYTADVGQNLNLKNRREYMEKILKIALSPLFAIAFLIGLIFEVISSGLNCAEKYFDRL